MSDEDELEKKEPEADSKENPENSATPSTKESLAEENPSSTGHSLNAVYDIPVQVSAVLGHVTMPVSQLLKLGRGAIVELDRHVGEAVDIYVNNRLIARGEVIVMEDRLGVTMTEILKSERF